MRTTSKPGWLFLLLALVAMLTLALSAACGGGDDDDDDGGDGSPTATEDSGDDDDDDGDDGGDEETPTEDAGDDDGDDGGDDSDEDLFAQLDELTGDLENVTGRITYDITNEDGTTSSMTSYAKPPNSRFDSTDGTTTSIIISTPDTTFICDSSTESCFSTPGSGDDSSSLGIFGAFLSPDVISGYVALAEASGVDVEQSGESINGIDATCFSWSEAADDSIDQGKICFNDEGVMIYEEFTSDTGTFKLEATDYSGDVADSDFEPPYEVTDIGG